MGSFYLEESGEDGVGAVNHYLKNGTREKIRMPAPPPS